MKTKKPNDSWIDVLIWLSILAMIVGLGVHGIGGFILLFLGYTAPRYFALWDLLALAGIVGVTIGLYLDWKRKNPDA